MRILLSLALLIVAFANNSDLFNYDATDGTNYGPEDWAQVTCDDVNSCTGWPDNWNVGMNWSLTENACEWCPKGSGLCSRHHQSPIELNRDVAIPSNPDFNECIDKHWMKYEDSSCTWDDLVKNEAFSVERSSLKISQPIEPVDDSLGAGIGYRLKCKHDGQDRLWGRIDFSKGFHDWWFLSHIDFKVPSEHTQNGRRYAGEVQMQHFYSRATGYTSPAAPDEPNENEMATVSFFLDSQDDFPPYPFLEEAICQWRHAEDLVREACNLPAVDPYPGCFNSARGRTPFPTKSPTVSPSPTVTASPTSAPTAADPTPGPTPRPTYPPFAPATFSPVAPPTLPPIASPAFVFGPVGPQPPTAPTVPQVPVGAPVSSNTSAPNTRSPATEAPIGAAQPVAPIAAVPTATATTVTTPIAASTTLATPTTIAPVGPPQTGAPVIFAVKPSPSASNPTGAPLETFPPADAPVVVTTTAPTIGNATARPTSKPTTTAPTRAPVRPSTAAPTRAPVRPSTAAPTGAPVRPSTAAPTSPPVVPSTIAPTNGPTINAPAAVRRRNLRSAADVITNNWDMEENQQDKLILDPSNFRKADWTEEQWAEWAEAKSAADRGVATKRQLLLAPTGFSTGMFHNYQVLIDVKTEYYFRYQGTQTVPPCYGKFDGSRRNTNHWRVLKDPVRVHPRQIKEMERLLKDRLNPDTCESDTAAKVEPDGSVSVARPLQDNNFVHYLVFCECQRWPSKWPEDRAWCQLQDKELSYRLFDHPYNFDSDGQF